MTDYVAEKKMPCGRPFGECGRSMSIADMPTFGNGKLVAQADAILADGTSAAIRNRAAEIMAGHDAAVTMSTPCERCGGCEYVCAEAHDSLVETLHLVSRVRGNDQSRAMLDRVQADSRTEIARLRAVTGPDCPRCGHTLKAEHTRDDWRFYCVALDTNTYVCPCEVVCSDLISDHPSIAKDLGLIA